ncbi:hypothetical protein [Paracidovorax citrulli]
MTRYRIEMLAAMVAYVLMLLGSIALLQWGGVTSDWARAAIALTPMIPGVGICWAVVRNLRRMDELQLRINLEALAVAFAGTALLTFAYGFLEGVGFPRLSLFVVWPLMAGLWIVGGLLCGRRYR